MHHGNYSKNNKNFKTEMNNTILLLSIMIRLLFLKFYETLIACNITV